MPIFEKPSKQELRQKYFDVLTPEEKRLLLLSLIQTFERNLQKFFEEDFPNIIDAKIDAILSKLVEKIESRLKETISEKINISEDAEEHVIFVKEISMEDAKKLVEEFISDKKGEIITALEIAEKLNIPYELAHEIFLQLIKEGKLEGLNEF